MLKTQKENLLKGIYLSKVGLFSAWFYYVEGPIWCKCLGTCNLHFDILILAPPSFQILPFCILQIIFFCCWHFKHLKFKLFGWIFFYILNIFNSSFFDESNSLWNTVLHQCRIAQSYVGYRMWQILKYLKVPLDRKYSFSNVEIRGLQLRCLQCMSGPNKVVFTIQALKLWLNKAVTLIRTHSLKPPF